ncbi:MAG: hypothetical protein A07HR67_00754, partial [uncultured archaeon A07HR67]
MVERSGRFRVYRVVESVPHINLQAVDDRRCTPSTSRATGRSR